MTRTPTRARSCRHYKGFRNPEGMCGIGHPIYKMTAAKAGGTHGIAFKIPCIASDEQIINCPDFCAKTDEDIAAQEAAAEAMFDEFRKVLAVIGPLKLGMIAANDPHRRVDCPACGGVETMQVSVAIGGNNHVHCCCSVCNAGFIE